MPGEFQKITEINAYTCSTLHSCLAEKPHAACLRRSDPEHLPTPPGRYLFLNAIANQLRYPNSHTNYFLHLILYLFAEANTPAIQEQITRSVTAPQHPGRGWNGGACCHRKKEMSQWVILSWGWFFTQCGHWKVLAA